jgi:DNA segregation ATPase FtsK/SpoIIIE-like protein
MSLDGFERRGLVHQADRIERVLSSLELPARIRGGQIREGRVRYFLAPTTDIQMQRIRQMAKRVAEEMGVYHVRVTESEGSLVLDLPMDEGNTLRLLPLLESVETPSPLTSIIGLNMKGEKFSIDFRNPASKHLIVLGGPRTGKSELLRTVLFSIALYCKQTQVNFLAIDLSGNELSVVEALPHGLTEIASESKYGIKLIHWLIDEIERREVFRIRYPELFLMIDDVEKLVEEDPIYMALLKRVIKEGKENCVHVIAATGGSFPLLHVTERQEHGLVKAEAVVESSSPTSGSRSPGDFRVCINREEQRVRVAWMPAFDLQEAVSLIQSGKNRRELQRGWVR